MLRLRVICREQKCEQVQSFHVSFKHFTKITMPRIVCAEICDLGLAGMKHESPFRWLRPETFSSTRGHLMQVESHSQTTEKGWKEGRIVTVDFVKFTRNMISGLSLALQPRCRNERHGDMTLIAFFAGLHKEARNCPIR